MLGIKHCLFEVTIQRKKRYLLLHFVIFNHFNLRTSENIPSRTVGQASDDVITCQLGHTKASFTTITVH